MAVYYATKAFVNSFSVALASEVRGRGVTVTVLCPGPTRSEFADASGMNATAIFEGRGVMGSRPVAEAGVRAMLAGKPLAIPGWRNRLLIFAERPPAAVVGGGGRASDAEPAAGEGGRLNAAGKSPNFRGRAPDLQHLLATVFGVADQAATL